jgi:hypothetical protein
MPLIDIVRDPSVFAKSHARKDGMARCIGLDLSNSTGIAIADFVPGTQLANITMLLGQWDLSLGKYDSGPLRHLRLRQFLAVAEPDLIMFEDVKNSGDQAMLKKYSITALIARAATQTEFQGALKCTVSSWADEREIPCHGLGISEIKKHATGKGNAGKPAIIKACNARFGTDFDPEEFKTTGVDNMADAAFVCEMGLIAYSETFQ